MELLRDFFLPEMVFLRYALLIGALSSIALGVIGTMVVTRRISSIAGASAHAALGGVGVVREDRLERGVKGVGRRIHLCVADHDVRVVLRAVPELDGFAQRVLRGVVVLRAAVCERFVRWNRFRREIVEGERRLQKPFPGGHARRARL